MPYRWVKGPLHNHLRLSVSGVDGEVVEPPVLVSRLEADPSPAAVPGVEGQGVGGLVDGPVVNLVNGGLVRIRVHVVGTVCKIQ